MNLHTNIDEILLCENTVVTIGNFDGVHKGHESLIRKTVELATQYDLTPMVFTFENHPLEFLYQKKIEYLNLPYRKLEILFHKGIEKIVSIPFDDYIMNMSTERFSTKILLQRLKAKHIVVGFDSRLGKGREGKVEYLKETGEKLGFTVHIIPPVLVDQMRVSSSYIRELIKLGDMESAERHLGRPYEIEGTVIHGQKLGRKLGFPTANIVIDFPLVLPKKGVYYCKTFVKGKEYDVAVSVGDNPTIEGKGFSIEGHILDFDGNLYGEIIRLYFMKRLRDEIRFETLEELITQLKNDITEIKNISLLYPLLVIE